MRSRHPLHVGPLPSRGQAIFRIPRALFEAMRADLSRPHEFSSERIGFLEVAAGTGEGQEHLLLAREYFSIPDHQYVRDPLVGARIGSAAVRWAIQRVLDSGRGLFHVHSHGGNGAPMFSATDISEQSRLVASFCSANRHLTHGMVVLSSDGANAWTWLPRAVAPTVVRAVSVIGYPFSYTVPPARDSHGHSVVPSDRFCRQSFLGPHAQDLLGDIKLGIVGLGGGGSHVAQQVGHVGVRHVRGFDGDTVELSNLNRLVGAGMRDSIDRTQKTRVAERMLRFITGRRDERMHFGRWEECPELLRSCDVVIGCVDTFAARRDLEATCRRWLIPYIDLGMDVHQVGIQSPRVGGQVILSIPGEPCMHCIGFLNPDRLGQEAARYGGAGNRPQVIWPNGVLASTGVGVLIDLVTGWTRRRPRLTYLSYDGNEGTMKEHPRVPYISDTPCPHYPLEAIGMPTFTTIDA